MNVHHDQDKSDLTNMCHIIQFSDPLRSRNDVFLSPSTFGQSPVAQNFTDSRFHISLLSFYFLLKGVDYTLRTHSATVPFCPRMLSSV